MTFIKKYRLSNADVKKLRSTWTLGAPSFESQNPRAMFAFKEMEELLLKRMRANYNPGKGDLMPWFAMAENNNSPDNVFIVGNTSCGKTTWLNKMLTNLNKKGENWATGRPIVCFSMHPEDPSLAPARKLFGGSISICRKLPPRYRWTRWIPGHSSYSMTAWRWGVAIRDGWCCTIY